jgi:hypothetical protein
MDTRARKVAANVVTVACLMYFAALFFTFTVGMFSKCKQEQPNRKNHNITHQCSTNGLRAIGTLGKVTVNLCESIESTTFSWVQIMINGTEAMSMHGHRGLENATKWVQQCLKGYHVCCSVDGQIIGSQAINRYEICFVDEDSFSLANTATNDTHILNISEGHFILSILNRNKV